ncbi:PqqD family protein [Dyadobacter sediminis]|nr:PqqD family protein [Dyadobacter sediminis]
MIKENGHIVELNESAQFIIDLLSQQNQTADSILAAVCAEYDVAASECQSDVTQTIDDLVMAGLLDVC